MRATSFLIMAITLFFLAGCTDDDEAIVAPPVTPIRVLTVPVGSPTFDATSAELSGTFWDLSGYGEDQRQTTGMRSEGGYATVWQTDQIYRSITDETHGVQAVQIIQPAGDLLPAFTVVATLAKATNGWIYQWLPDTDNGQVPTGWVPFAPAHPVAGDRWTLDWWPSQPNNLGVISGQWTITVTSTQAGSPNLYANTDCLALEVTGGFANGPAGDGRNNLHDCKDFRSVEYFLPNGWLVHRRTTYACTVQSMVIPAVEGYVSHPWSLLVTEEEVGGIPVPLVPQAVN